MIQCAKCMKKIASSEKFKFVCPQCRKVAYCSKECLKNAKKQHKKVCADMANEEALAQKKPSEREESLSRQAHENGIDWQSLWTASYEDLAKEVGDPCDSCECRWGSARVGTRVH